MKGKFMKVVINVCFGGFSLSDKAILRYIELSGKEIKETNNSYIGLTVFTTDGDEYNCYKPFSDNRTDPLLVQVVEELGDEADGRCAELRVVEIPDNVEWEIDDYDGNESIEEVHRSWR